MMDDMTEKTDNVQRPRRPLCTDCRGAGKTMQPKAFATREFPGVMGSAMVLGTCPACRGKGTAGA